MIVHADYQSHERFYRHLRERDVAFDVHVEYKSKGTFVGASVEVASASDLDKLTSAEGVLVSSLPSDSPLYLSDRTSFPFRG